jgi:hypothetical protein
MDQLRTILTWLKQQHFWVLSVLVALIGLACWWSAARTLSTEYEGNQKTITTQFQNLTTLRSDPFHPNDDINKRQIEETNKLVEEVAELWHQLYDRQREHVLKWPPALNQRFRDYVEKLEFGEDIPSDIVVDGKRENLREHYQNYVWRHFPALPEKIGALPLEEDAVGARGGGGLSRGGRGTYQREGGTRVTAEGSLEEDQEDYICEWMPEDQAAVRAELEFPTQPSPLRIWVTQENLWVYHALLNVIKNTNDAAGASRMSNAAVRTLYSLEVGQRAAPYSRTPDRIYKLAMPAATTEDGAAFGAEQGGQEAPSGQMPGGMDFGRSGLAEGASGGPMSDAQEAAFFLSHRYLGEDGKPIPLGGAGMDAGGGEVDSSAGVSGPVDPSMFGKEYKRLPVRMVLEMDQRHLPRLVAECAIQPLQVEVQEVRVNVPDAIGTQRGGSSVRRGFGEGSGLGRGGSLFPELTELQEFPVQPNIVTVVIQGVIYIFNKPDPEILKTTTDGESFVAIE